MSARMAILGLLVEQPRHGYALDRAIEERHMRNWAAIGFSSIYWVLDRLVEEGLAEVAEIQAGGRSGGRRVFRATEAGFRLWHDQSIAGLAEFERPIDDFLLALSCLPALDPRQARAALERRLAAIGDRLAVMRADRERSGSVLPRHVTELFAYGEAILEAQRAWLAGFLADRWPSPIAEEVVR